MKYEELQSMTREQLENAFTQKNKSWAKRGRKINRDRLITTIYYAYKDYLSYSAEIVVSNKDRKGCRDLWYDALKPIVNRADPEFVDDPNVDAAAYAEGILSKLVKEKNITYASLGVRDYVTLREVYQDINHARCWSRELLFIEKEAVGINFVDFVKLWNMNLVCGHGWGHTAGIEGQISDLLAMGIKSLDNVFGLVDYDNFGHAIFQEFLVTCEKLGLHIEKSHRIGVNPDQVPAERLEVQKYPLKRDPKRNKLCVRGLNGEKYCFDTDVWLEKFGIPDENGEKRFGLEIEAVSGQPNGYQILREIVARELLEYLDENDRIEEITNEKWKRAPFEAIKSFIYAIDRGEDVTDNAILGTLKFPSRFVIHSTFLKRYYELDDKEKAETADIDEEIASLKEYIEQLQSKRSDIAYPYLAEKLDLQENYSKSRDLIAHALYLHYQNSVAQYPRQNFSLGFPPGCILEAVKKQSTLQEFLKPIEDPHVDQDLQDALNSDFSKHMADGTIDKILSDIFKKQNDRKER